MKCLVGVIAVLSLVACSEPPPTDNPDSSAGASPATAAPSGNWRTLFDGSGLSAFRINGDANWQIDSDVVGADTGSGMLVTNEVFDDFELEVEFWVDVPANSGIFLRCPDPAEVTDTTCYEVNIFDTRPDQTYRTGGIVNIASPAVELHAGGRWNRYEITALGERLQVVLNGEPVVDVEDGRFSSGHIGLQYGAGIVKFRNVRIRTL